MQGAAPTVLPRRGDQRRGDGASLVRNTSQHVNSPALAQDRCHLLARQGSTVSVTLHKRAPAIRTLTCEIELTRNEHKDRDDRLPHFAESSPCVVVAAIPRRAATRGNRNGQEDEGHRTDHARATQRALPQTHGAEREEPRHLLQLRDGTEDRAGRTRRRHDREHDHRETDRDVQQQRARHATQERQEQSAAVDRQDAPREPSRARVGCATCI